MQIRWRPFLVVITRRDAVIVVVASYILTIASAAALMLFLESMQGAHPHTWPAFAVFAGVITVPFAWALWIALHPPKLPPFPGD